MKTFFPNVSFLSFNWRDDDDGGGDDDDDDSGGGVKNTCRAVQLVQRPRLLPPCGLGGRQTCGFRLDFRDFRKVLHIYGCRHISLPLSSLHALFYLRS